MLSSTQAVVISVGVFFHAVYVWSIFDIYFQSPILKDLPPVPLPPVNNPPAKRLVIFVADGCRADSFFEASSMYAADGQEAFSKSFIEPSGTNHHHHHSIITNNNTRVPFLRNIMENVGAFGVSHTRVPTESRPGHVALFAGFYEDVSAVTKGWAANPVEFDSIFNQSSSSFLFGSPDIVPMFATNFDHVHEQHYSHEEEDFAASDASSLDVWVVNKLEGLLSNATSNNPGLNATLNQDNVVFFLHFLGIDTNGHAHRPSSKEYLANIALMDAAVATATEAIEAFYNFDNKTAFIMTADHGMSAKGAHGDGDPANTRTPVVAWGAGITGPESKLLQNINNNPSLRQVRAQYDAASEKNVLSSWNISTLVRRDMMQADIAVLGSSLLGMSVPSNSIGVLPTSYLQSGLYKESRLRLNAQTILTQAREKARRVRQRHWLYFSPHLPLEAIESTNKDDNSMTVINTSLEAIAYYETYDYALLMTVISLGYVSWICVLLFLYSNDDDINNMTIQTIVKIGVPAAVVLACKTSPWSYYLYTMFPVLFISFLLSQKTRWNVQQSTAVVLLLLLLELIVIGYHERSVFALIFLILAFSSSSSKWISGCVALAVFPLLPSEYGDHLELVYSGTIVLILLTRRFRMHVTVVVVVALSIILVYVTMSFYITLKLKPPTVLFVSNWAVSIGGIILFFITKQHHQTKKSDTLLRVAVALAPVYTMLSIAYETWFYATLTFVLLQWLEVSSSSRDDTKVAFVYLCLIKIAFFGTGNVASMSSFEISSTYRFLTIFSPFTMGGLLILKILIPFLLVTVTFQLVVTQKERVFKVFLLVLAMVDVLSLNFFFLVKNTGSWKEIGNSISMFGIVNAQIVFIPLLFVISKFFSSSAALKTE